MDIAATVTSKGQITIPAPVRRALRLRAGTRLVFHLDEGAVTVESAATGRTARLMSFPDFFALAGSVSVPPDARGASWPQIRAKARSNRGPGRS